MTHTEKVNLTKEQIENCSSEKKLIDALNKIDRLVKAVQLKESGEKNTARTEYFRFAASAFIECLDAYNAGKSSGKWIDLTLGREHVEEQIKEILDIGGKISGNFFQSEEYEIHDSEGPWKMDSQSIDEIFETMDLLEALDGDIDVDLICDLSEYLGCDIEKAISYHEENYRGEFDSDEDMAIDFTYSTGVFSDVSESLERYFDHESYARDLMCDIFEIDGHYYKA